MTVTRNDPLKVQKTNPDHKLVVAPPAHPARLSIPLVAVMLVALLVAAEAAASGARSESKPAVAAYGHLPLTFVANVGQTDARAAFVAHGRGHTLFVSPTETVFVVRPPAPAGQGLADRLRFGRGAEPGSARNSQEGAGAVVHMRLLDADGSAVMTGEEQSTSVNYLIGSDRSRWHTGVPAYARVRARGVYPGVDLVF